MNNRSEAIRRLHELQSEHAAATGDGPGEAPGFTEDIMVTRRSYRLVAADALDSGVLTEADLEAEGLPKSLG